jgi:hypothetical protein
MIDSTPPDAALPRSITLEFTLEGVLPDGSSAMDDFDPTAVLAWSDGHSLSPTKIATGRYRIDDVPPGPAYVGATNQQDITFLVKTTGTDVVFNSKGTGRPVGPVAKSTTLVLNVSPMMPWMDGDGLEYTDPNTGLLDADGPTVTAGATSLMSLVEPYGKLSYAPLIDSTQGDRLTVGHIRTNTVGDLQITQTIETFEAPPFVMTDGAANAVTGSFAPVPQASVDIDVDIDAFEKLAIPGNGGMFLDVMSERQAVEEQDLLRILALNTPSKIQGTFTYGDIASPGTDRVAYLQVFDGEYFHLPDGQEGTLWENVERYAKLPLAGPLEPDITPPSSPVIDATPDAPVISWQGSPLATAYFVRLELGDSSGFFFGTTIVTTDTSVSVPPGLLTSGKTYGIIIDAVRMPGVDLLSTPWEWTEDLSLAPTFVGLLEVP